MRVRKVEHIHLDLPDPVVHAKKKILELTWAGGGSFMMEGPERVAITGRNGVGKTTLIEQMLLASSKPVVSSSVPQGRLFTHRVGYLPQALTMMDESVNAIENILVVSPSATPAQVRAQLARMLLRGDAVFRPVSSLSGGERFRVCMARLLFAEPPAQLIILDEPTNNLDMTSVSQLVEALASYRGAVLVVSHDRDFLS
jgi:ATPase subunit of ABC transporter with duplicated ATPase domains